MIARIWRGSTPDALADDYHAFLLRTGVEDYRATEGNQGVWLLRRALDGRTEFLLISLWESEEAIRRFAGDDIRKAFYYPEDPDYLLEMVPEVEHFEVLLRL
jgi:heme-degrading monooxygenase HmoA